MKVIFCGTPEIAVPSLEALLQVAEVVGVVCQPDRRSGRGMHHHAPPVKKRALELGLPVFQPEKIRDGSLASWMREREADVALVIAYGRILTEQTLGAPRLGCVNLHASLLPAYRGAAPIQRVLMDGGSSTGVCLMQMDAGMDTGPVLSFRKIAIESEDNAGSLAKKLGELAALVTREDLPRFIRGELTPIPQDNERATYAPPIEKVDTYVDFNRPAQALVNQIRGLAPRPGALARFQRQGKTLRVKLLEASPARVPLRLQPGEVGADHHRLFVGTGDGNLELQHLQVEGKKAQAGVDVLNGRLLTPGDRLHHPLDAMTTSSENTNPE